MADIDDLMKKYGLTSLGIAYGNEGGGQAWHGSVSDKGYVGLFPPEPGVFSGVTIDEAVRKVAECGFF
jgi:hypothetical protein